MLTVTATDAWRRAHPGAAIGLLELTGVDNTQPAPKLEARKREIEARVRAQYQGFTRPAFLALLVLAAYDRYYTRFNKTYHVQLQLESIVLKGKALPSVSPAVDANFMAEIETLVLTAGHDAQKLSGAITLDVSRDDDAIQLMNGGAKVIRAGDMIMRDAEGVSCSIIYGQDARSPITPATTRVLYVAYAPAGVPVSSVTDQLSRITAYVQLATPAATVAQQGLLTA